MPFREVYHRTPEDPNYLQDRVDETDEIQALIQQIKMVMFTRQGQVMGVNKYGVSIEDYLFRFGLSLPRVRTIITEQINKFIPLSHRYSVEVELGYLSQNDEESNTVFIDFTINNEKAFGTIVSL